MPLVTRQVNQANLFKQDAEPTGVWVNGDLWSDTDDGLLYLNVGDAAELVKRTIPELIIYG